MKDQNIDVKIGWTNLRRVHDYTRELYIFGSMQRLGSVFTLGNEWIAWYLPTASRKTFLLSQEEEAYNWVEDQFYYDQYHGTTVRHTIQILKRNYTPRQNQMIQGLLRRYRKGGRVVDGASLEN